MSKTTLVSGLAVAVLAVVLVMQQQTISQLRQDNDALKQQTAQVTTMQAQLAQATQDAAEAGKAAVAQEAQARELAHLRAETQVLRQETNELAKAQREIQSLNDRAAAEAARASDAEAKAADATARANQASRQPVDKEASSMNACINNLRLIDAAKQQWALENKKTAADTPTWDDLRPYIGRGPNGELPSCPDGGVYTIGTVAEKPACSVPNHVLP